MSSYLLGLDYGTGGGKACIIDEEANVLAYAYREYPIYNDRPGWSEHDGELYWKVACQVIKECLEISGIQPKDIKGIGTSSALPSMVMVDKNHNPINRAYNLMDRRATEEVKWLIDNIGNEKLFAITGNRLEDHPEIVNLMWEKKNRPESFAKIYKALTIDGYIRLKLTGKATTSYSSGVFFGAYNIHKREFDKEILNQVGIDFSIMPELFSSEALIGEVTVNAAEESGLIPGIPVCAGQVDCNAGWIGGGAIYEGDVQLNLGTCGNFGIIHKDPNFLESMINFAYTIDSENTYITVPTTTTGGQLLRYLRDNFSQLEVAMEKVVNINTYQYLDMEAEQINLGSDGLIVLPYLMGERTPIWDNDARGVIFGLSLNHTKAHIVRAMMESVAFALYDSFRIIKESGKKINYPIVLNEGGAKSKIWRRIITDVFNAPTTLVKSRVGAPYGDAILAGVATGVFKDYSIAREKTEYVDLMEPIKENHEKYMEIFQQYKKLYESLKPNFKDLTQLKKKLY